MINILEKIRTKIPSSDFTRHVITLMTGTILAQVITVASAPVFTQIYTPEEFGAFALLQAISGVFAEIATGSYELAIMLPKEDEDSINLVALCVVIASFLSIGLFLLIWFSNTQIAKLLGNSHISVWLYLMPLQVILSSTYQSFNYWSNRKKQYKRLALSRMLQSASMALVSICLGWIGLGLFGLILGSLLGQVLATGLLGFKILREERSILRFISLQNMKSQAKLYDKFPKHLTLSHFIGMVHFQAPIFFISRLFGTETLGFYSLALRFITLPSTMIANAIGEVFRREATEHYWRDGKFNSLLQTTVKKTFLIALPIYPILIFFSPQIFSIVFGQTWKTSGEYASIFATASFFSFVITPIDRGVVIVGATKYIFCWHFSNLISNILLGVIFINFNLGMTSFLWCLVGVKIIHYLTEYFVTLKYSRGEKLTQTKR